MAEIESRELEYFLAVAEELHFSRAAARLSIAQPALSKAIRRLETRLSARVLERSSRHVALTAAGAALEHHGRHALNAIDAAVDAARRAAEPQARLRLVIKPGGDANLLSGILAAYARRPDARQVDILFGGNTDRTDYLRDGRADVALLYVPFDDVGGLDHITVHVEGRVAILARDHPLAERAALRLADLAGEPTPRWEGLDDGASGPEVADLAQMIQLVALGRTIAMLPRSLIEPAPPGIVCVPVIDAPSSQLVLAWPTTSRCPLIAPFIDAIRAEQRDTRFLVDAERDVET